MKALFTKVLLLLLVSFLAVVVVSVSIFQWMRDNRWPDGFRLDEFSRRLASELVWEHEHGNPDRFSARLRRRFNITAWILGEDGVPIGRRPPPQGILDQVDVYPKIVFPRWRHSGGRFIFAHEIASDRQTYRVIMVSHPPLHEHGRNHFAFPWLLVVVPALALALVCASALLAFWILAPVRVIGRSTSILSEENLEARVPDRVTRRKDVFGELGREFNRMSERVKRAISNQNQLLRDVSHELRSPLARIQVAASLSEQKHGESTELDRIQDEVVRLDNLIEDLLTLSRLKGRNCVSMTEVDVIRLLDELVENANYEFQQFRRRALLAGPARLSVRGNAELLSSMYENVMRNGLRYTPDNGLLRVDCCLECATAVVLIVDQGPGVNEQSLQSIFEPFCRVDGAGDTAVAGNHGIGLALAKAIAELHGGKISAANNDDGGLTVTIAIPVSTPPELRG